jgi:hypothetical protein
MKTPDDVVPMLPTVDPEARLVFIVNAASGSLACDVKRVAIEAAFTEAGRAGSVPSELPHQGPIGAPIER